MDDVEHSNEPRTQPTSNPGGQHAGKGFGELSGGYRAKWALSHPDMRSEWRPDAHRDAQSTDAPDAIDPREERPGEQGPDEAGSGAVHVIAAAPNAGGV
jgi:hypothetical protein